MQVSNAKFRALNMHREEDLRPTTQILDIAVPAVLRASGNRPRALLPDLLFQLRACRASMHVLRLWRFGDNAIVC